MAMGLPVITRSELLTWRPRRGGRAAARPPWRDRDQRLPAGGSARLAVRLVLPAVRAVLAELYPVGVVAAVLAGDVVAVLALLTSQRDLRPDVCRSHECLSSPASWRCRGQARAWPQQ